MTDIGHSSAGVAWSETHFKAGSRCREGGGFAYNNPWTPLTHAFESWRAGYEAKDKELSCDWTSLSKNLHDPVASWPNDLREAFIRRLDTFWSAPMANDTFENADTERACRLGNKVEEDAFKAATEEGCCGSHDEDWEFDVPSGRVTVRYGFNHGH